MARLFIVILSVCFVFGTLTGVATLIGRQQPLPERLAMLRLTDCAPPCWIGIVPGVTKLDEAKVKVQAVLGSIANYSLSFDGPTLTFMNARIRQGSSQPIWIISIQTHGSDIKAIWFNCYECGISYADWLNAWGTYPDEVVMMPDLTIKGAYEGQCQLLLINERFNALLKTDHGVNHLNLSKQLYQVGFMVPELVPGSSYATFQLWSGFSSCDRYITSKMRRSLRR